MPFSSQPFRYDTAAFQRRSDEGPKKRYRTEYERDLARVEHSHALRRLSDVTQVFQADGLRRVRNRYSHSVEVANIGRFLARQLGPDADIVAGAGLAHDLGHPPFGHHGEIVLNSLARDIGGFEANAQTFRVLTRLEPKRVLDGKHFGLNLTRAFVDATLKYPYPRGARSGHKFGFYEEDAEAFTWLRTDAPDEIPCVEAQLMEWADDVAYSTHDLEDGIIAGLIDVSCLADFGERRALCEATVQRAELPLIEVEAAYERLIEWDAWAKIEALPPSYEALAVVKSLTSDLIDRFAGAVVEATQAANNAPLGRYTGVFVIPIHVRAEAELLQSLVWRYVIESERFVRKRENEAQVLRDLVARLIVAVHRGEEAAVMGLDDMTISALWANALAQRDEKLKVRGVIDTVAALTDQQCAVL